MVDVTSPTTRHKSLAPLQQQLFITNHDRCCLLSLRAGSNFEIHIRRRDFQLREEIAGHARVVVLPRVDETIFKCGTGLLPLANGADYRRNFHEVRACAGNYVDQIFSH